MGAREGGDIEELRPWAWSYVEMPRGADGGGGGHGIWKKRMTVQCLCVLELA